MRNHYVGVKIGIVGEQWLVVVEGNHAATRDGGGPMKRVRTVVVIDVDRLGEVAHQGRMGQGMEEVWSC